MSTLGARPTNNSVVRTPSGQSKITTVPSNITTVPLNINNGLNNSNGPLNSSSGGNSGPLTIFNGSPDHVQIGALNVVSDPLNATTVPSNLASNSTSKNITTATPTNKAMIAEMKADTSNAVQCLLGLQIGTIVLALLVASPLIFRHLKTGRFKRGWFLAKNQAAPANPATVSIISQSVNRSSDVPVGHKSTALQVRFRQLYAMIFLKTIPGIQTTTGRLFFIAIFLHVLIFGLLYKNISNPLENFWRPGWVAAIFLPVQFLLAMKNSPISLIGKSYERVNYIHRFIGRAIYVMASTHGFLWGRRKWIANTPIIFKGASFYGLIALISLSIISMSSVKWVRRKLYQTFLVFHIFGYLALLFALWNHVPQLRLIVAVSTSFVGIDYLLVYLKTSIRSAVFTSLPGGVTRVEIDRIGEGWVAGQHVYLRVFKGRHSFEKHPFTIANAPASVFPFGRNTLLLMAKASGDFTTSLHRVGYAEAALVGGDVENRKASVDEKHFQALCQAASDCRLAVAVEGPYGTSYMDMCDHETAVLVAGGSGFTYSMATLEHIVGNAMKGTGYTKKIFVVWTLRDLDMVQVFSSALNSVLECAQQLRFEVVVRLFVTMPLKHGDINPVPMAQITPSRVDLKAVLSEALESTCWSIDARGETQGCGVAIGVCGPEGLAVTVRKEVCNVDKSLASKAGGIQLHSEVFSC
ncbi:hypothetical protein PCANC_01354 [Puccinia coronata f. sp. avenae]|uniref:ferric-chelate reductase (NADPH) n=1 Tax=Puccinia coronata f. sp. avenae TaxID=200324 RepID=A0A2N5W632_9BASI|nr:hypothetical protein PCANC_01354 [Puccinia coronata f. sp. avenae]